MFKVFGNFVSFAPSIGAIAKMIRKNVTSSKTFRDNFLPLPEASKTVKMALLLNFLQRQRNYDIRKTNLKENYPSMPKKKIFIIVGARPNYMKAAPLLVAFKEYPKIKTSIIHTGQHYDDEMNKVFFENLMLPRPDIYLGVGSGTHAEQTGKIMIKFEKVLIKQKPDLVAVVGDVNSTLACAIDAVKLFIPVAHIEAGLRSFDMTMPEEVNRILTDQISDYLFTSCEDANVNLKKEGIPEEKIFFVGNVMIDTLLKFIKRAQKTNALVRYGLKQDEAIRQYALLTLHRPSNVDDRRILMGILDALNQIAEYIPVIFPVHPRTLKRIGSFKLQEMVTYVEDPFGSALKQDSLKVITIPPLGYLDFLNLMANAFLVLTDSGGIQEETTILGIPCLTLRRQTERPVTVREGTNEVIGNDPQKIREAVFRVLKTGGKKGKMPKFWDGRAAARIAGILADTI
jgi:UDP-N-acetylglucosamine 2-epimerase (non-hydrolysing)